MGKGRGREEREKRGKEGGGDKELCYCWILC